LHDQKLVNLILEQILVIHIAQNLVLTFLDRRHVLIHMVVRIPGQSQPIPMAALRHGLRLLVIHMLDQSLVLNMVKLIQIRTLMHIPVWTLVLIIEQKINDLMLMDELILALIPPVLLKFLEPLLVQLNRLGMRLHVMIRAQLIVHLLNMTLQQPLILPVIPIIVTLRQQLHLVNIHAIHMQENQLVIRIQLLHLLVIYLLHREIIVIVTQPLPVRLHQSFVMIIVVIENLFLPRLEILLLAIPHGILVSIPPLVGIIETIQLHHRITHMFPPMLLNPLLVILVAVVVCPILIQRNLVLTILQRMVHMIQKLTLKPKLILTSPLHEPNLKKIPIIQVMEELRLIKILQLLDPIIMTHVLFLVLHQQDTVLLAQVVTEVTEDRLLLIQEGEVLTPIITDHNKS